MSANIAKASKATDGAPARAVAPATRDIDTDMLLAALPHPILVIAADNKIDFANAAAEAFFSTSASTLKRSTIADIVAFGCPLLSLIEQEQTSGAMVNEYGVEVAAPRFASPKLIDVYGGPMPEDPRRIFLMLQQRNMAQMIERQFTHRAAARSVSGMAGVLAHEIKNPLSGIRGAAQLLEPGLSDEDRSLAQLICTETDRIRDSPAPSATLASEQAAARSERSIA